MKQVYLILSLAVSVMLCSAVQSSAADLSDGLVAYYPFNGNAADESGNGHDGTVYGATLTSDRFENLNSAYEFDGVSDYINCGNIINGFSNYTISAWIKIDRYTHYRYMGPWGQMLLANPPANLNSTICMFTTSDPVSGFGTVMRWLDGTLLNTRTGHAVPYNEWHLITQTYDGNAVRQYDNGHLVNETLSPGHTVSNSWDFLIGKVAAYPNHLLSVFYFDGAIDDVRIYNRALSEQEVQELYTEDGGSSAPMLEIYTDVLTNTFVVAGESVSRTMTLTNAGNADLEFSFCGPLSESNGLIAYYPFNGNAADESGNGHDGAVYGATLTSDRFENLNSAYEFNGVSDYINCGNIINGFSNYTISAWIKIDRYTHYRYMGPWGQMLFANPPANMNSTICMFTTSDPVYGFGTVMRWLDGTLLNTRTGHAIPYNEWHMITQTYDGNAVRQYDNGHLVNETLSPGHTVSNSWDFLIGKLAAYPNHLLSVFYFDGAIDDLRIYNRALSAEEIEDLVIEDDDGLVASYLFNGNANDESDNGHNGIVYGAMLTNDRFGRPDAAYHFDGLDDYIDLGLFDAGVKAVSMWIRQGYRNEFEFYFGHNTFRLYASTLSGGLLMCGDGSSSKTYSTVSMDDHEDLWVHVVAVRDGVNSKVYFNGADATESSGNVGPALASVVNLGRWPGPVPSARHYMEGDIDDVRVYDRILSEADVLDLYSETPVEECPLPDWLAVDPKSGTVAPGESMDVAITFNASNRVAGDYAEHMLTFVSNDPEYPELEAPVSMWVIPSVPEIQTEPLCTIGSSNVVAWSYQEGPVEYWVEAMAVQHYAPASRSGNNSTPLGWDAKKRFSQNLDFWSKESGWIESTSCLFTDLRLNTIYMYRVKASVMTEIGRLEGEWSDWTPSCQVPVLPNSIQ